MKNFPPELIAKVLRYNILPFHVEPFAIDARRLIPALVCKKWGEAVDSDHIVWTKIFLDSFSALPLLKEALRKSGTLPLHVHVELDSFVSGRTAARAELLCSAMTLLEPHMQRWKGLTIETQSAQATLDFLAYLQQVNLPELQHAEFELQPVAWQSLLPTMQWSSLNPAVLASLSSLRINHHWVPMSTYAPFAFLHELHLVRLCAPWPELKAALETSPHLEYLQLADVSSPAFPLSVHWAMPAVLPKLSYLDFSAFATEHVLVLTRMNLPCLATLRCDVAYPGVMSTFVDLCAPIFAGVSSLTLLCGVYDVDVVRALLLGAASLQRLDAVCCPFPFATMCMRVLGETSRILPHLNLVALRGPFGRKDVEAFLVPRENVTAVPGCSLLLKTEEAGEAILTRYQYYNGSLTTSNFASVVDWFYS
ncbi:hypothetical protein C8R43DRAFT_1120226 [Mycena crocata]|nr:hypothetical protein C8R43DRAFT_1120226 [Mycena crocata]